MLSQKIAIQYQETSVIRSWSVTRRIRSRSWASTPWPGSPSRKWLYSKWNSIYSWDRYSTVVSKDEVDKEWLELRYEESQTSLHLTAFYLEIHSTFSAHHRLEIHPDPEHCVLLGLCVWIYQDPGVRRQNIASQWLIRYWFPRRYISLHELDQTKGRRFWLARICKRWDKRPPAAVSPLSSLSAEKWVIYC